MSFMVESKEPAKIEGPGVTQQLGMMDGVGMMDGHESRQG